MAGVSIWLLKQNASTTKKKNSKKTGRNPGDSLYTKLMRMEPYCKTVKQKKEGSWAGPPPLQQKQVVDSWRCSHIPVGERS